MNTQFVPLAVLTLALLVAACASGGPAQSASPAAQDLSTDPGRRGGGSGSAPGDPGSLPPDAPVGGVPGGGNGGGGNVGGNPGGGNPQLVVPVPGQLNVHPVAIEELAVRVDGRHAVLNAIWWSGIEPCYVLDSVTWKLDGTTISVSVREGNGPEDVMCIEIAVQKATVIDLGELAPGEYTVKASDGNAPDITFTIE